MLLNQEGALDQLFEEAGLASSNLKVATNAAKRLRWAVADNQFLQQAAREAGAMPLLSRLLQAEATDDAAVRSACIAIYTLTHRNPGCQDAAGAADIVPRLLVLLGGGAGPLAERTQVDVCTALGLLCVGHRANQAAAHRHGAVELLVAIAAYSRHEEGRLRACFALGCLSAANPSLRSAIVMAGGVRAAVALLPPHAPAHDSANARVRNKRLQALAALRDLTLGHTSGQLDAIAAGALDLVLKLLRDSPTVAASAVTTLSALLGGTHDIQRTYKSTYGIRELTMLLKRCDDGKSSSKKEPAEPPSEREVLCASVCRAIETLACGDKECQTMTGVELRPRGDEKPSAHRLPTALESLLSLAGADENEPLRHPEVRTAALGAINACIGGPSAWCVANCEKVLASGGVEAMLHAMLPEKKHKSYEEDEKVDDAIPGSAYGGLAALVSYHNGVTDKVLHAYAKRVRGKMARAVTTSGYTDAFELSVTHTTVVERLFKKLRKRLRNHQALPAPDDPAVDSDSPLAPLAAFEENRMAREQRRAASEAATGIASLIGVLVDKAGEETAAAKEAVEAADKEADEEKAAAHRRKAAACREKAGRISEGVPLEEHHVQPLLWTLDLTAEAARAAITCMMQLLKHRVLTVRTLVRAMSFEKNEYGVGRGFVALVQRLVPAHHWRRLGTISELPHMPTPDEQKAYEAYEKTDPAAASSEKLAHAASALLIAISDCGSRPNDAKAGIPYARKMLHEAGAAAKLAGALRTPSAMIGTEGFQIQITAFGCAVNSYPPAQDAAAKHDAVRALMHLLRHGCMDTRMRCLNALSNLIAGHSSNRDNVRWQGGIKDICELVRPTGVPEGAASHAIVALLHLASNDTDGQNEIEAAGGLAAIGAFWMHHVHEKERASGEPSARVVLESSGSYSLRPVHSVYELDRLTDEQRARRQYAEAMINVAERALYEMAFNHEPQYWKCESGEREKPPGFRIAHEVKQAALAGKLVWTDGHKAWNREWARWRKERTRREGDGPMADRDDIDIGDEEEGGVAGWVKTRVLKVGTLVSSRAR